MPRTALVTGATDGIGRATALELARCGYTVHARSGWTAEFGGAQAVLVDQIAGRRHAGADRRREGWAVAY